MSFLPPDFGGFVCVWDPRNADKPYALVVRMGNRDGKHVEEGIRLTPLNVLQLRKVLDSLIAEGEMEGYITAEHHAQSAKLSTVATNAEDAKHDIMPRARVDEIAGDG